VFFLKKSAESAQLPSQIDSQDANLSEKAAGHFPLIS